MEIQSAFLVIAKKFSWITFEWGHKILYKYIRKQIFRTHTTSVRRQQARTIFPKCWVEKPTSLKVKSRTVTEIAELATRPNRFDKDNKLQPLVYFSFQLLFSVLKTGQLPTRSVVNYHLLIQVSYSYRSVFNI